MKINRDLSKILCLIGGLLLFVVITLNIHNIPMHGLDTLLIVIGCYLFGMGMGIELEKDRKG